MGTMISDVVLFSWVHVVVAFVGGVSAGLAAARLTMLHNTKDEEKSQQTSSLEWESALQLLEADGKIKIHLSPADNAVFILESSMSYEMHPLVRASIVYAMNVLKTDPSNATVPVGLNLDKKEPGSQRKFSLALDEGESAIFDWLRSTYTPQPQVAAAPTKSKLTFKKVAQGVTFAIKLQNALEATRNSRDMFIYDVEPEEYEAINKVLDTVDNWDFDIWRLKEVTKGRPLQTLGWHLLHKWELLRIHKLDRNIVRNWLIYVEKLYNDTKYHNSTHAADVLQAVHHLLIKAGGSEYLTSLHILALLVTACIHDAGHDGFNNLYHQNAITDRALTFNDQSIQENFHCMTIFSNMSKDSSINILEVLKPEQAKEMRRLMILMTLGTDMKNHFKHFQEFKSLIGSRGRGKDEWISDSICSDALCANILHAADLSNPCRKFDVAYKWAEQVLQEFFHQGDKEMEEGLPVSPLCSRDTTLLPASQIGFINFIVLPYFQALAELLPGLKEGIVRQLESNLHRWRMLEQEEARAAAAAVAAANGGVGASLTSPSASAALLNPPVLGMRSRRGSGGV